MKEFKEIKSKENSLIKLTSSLQNSSKTRNETGLFVLEGLRICSDAFDNGIRFDKLIISNSAFSKYKNVLEQFSENSDESFIIPDTLFKKISDTDTPQGILAIAKRLKNSENFDKKGRYIALENLQDPSNLGAIARTAEALGVSGLILSKGSCDPYSPKSLRASMGTLLRLPIYIFDNFISDIKSLGLTTYACVVDVTAKKINEISFANGCALLIGNEGNGLTEETKINSDYCVTIPMLGKAESLNAAIAASISAWEMMK